MHSEKGPETTMTPGEPQQFTKKPITIWALQWTGENIDAVHRFMQTKDVSWNTFSETAYIPTLEGLMSASKGDWIIKGVKGEFYPCKPDIFETSYAAAKSGSAGTADSERIVQAEIASSTGPTGGWLESPKAVCASIVQKLREYAPSEEWVSVEERLPDTDMQVLVWRGTSSDTFRIVLQWFMKRDRWSSGFFDDGEMDTNVTHWRPLPPAPSKEKR